jgi:L-galactose dehydrogenase
MKVDYLDIMICHDIEFVDYSYVINETLPALRKQVEKGKVRFIGVSGYPMSIFKGVMSQTDIDLILTYNHYTLQNDMATQLVPICKAKGVGIINGAPFAARMLADAPLPVWHKATPLVREVTAKAAAHCRNAGSDIAKLALQFSIANPDFTTCVAGSANPQRIAQWVKWASEPVDENLMNEVKEILKPIHNWFHIEGLPENNDPVPQAAT